METTVAVEVFYKAVALVIKLSAVSKVFLCALRKIVLINKVISRVIGRVYVPTDFDTKEKALSGAKAAEKGLK